MIKKLVDTFLSDTLLTAFAVFMLILFVLMLLSPNRTLWLGESNLVILASEICVCVFTVTWAIRRIVVNITRSRLEA